MAPIPSEFSLLPLNHAPDAPDRLLATTSLTDASVFAGASQKVDDELAKAQAELDLADAELLDGKFQKAVGHYRHAWEHARKANMEANK